MSELGAITQRVAPFVCHKLNVTAKMWSISGQAYMSSPAVKQEIEESQRAVVRDLAEEEQDSMEGGAKELDKATVLEFIKRVELANAQMQQRLLQLLNMRAIAPNTFPVAMEVEKLLSFDKLFLEKGIEKHEIDANFKKLNLQEDTEFIEMIKEIRGGGAAAAAQPDGSAPSTQQ